MSRNAASEAQFRAARPDASTWLAANAGSGKTKVLTDRVARLLLRGVEPQHILCLTYTKAAASEMQNRLFQRLGEWAMLPDAKLRAALVDLGAEDASVGDGLAQARTLFARAIETPGGLKIQTIHSFCSSLLRRFPLEAGVSPQFSEMEDRAAAMLRAEITEDMAQGSDAHVVEAASFHIGGLDFESLTAEICRRQAGFDPDLDRNALGEVFELPAGYDLEALRPEVFLGNEADILSRTIEMLKTGGKQDSKDADKLNGFNLSEPNSIEKLEKVFLYASGQKAGEAKLDRFPTKKLKAAFPDLVEELQQFMARVATARPRRLALDAMEKSLVLHDFARVFLPEYERRKQLRGWLDFDDLIVKARNLLNDPAVAAWVLYRLDGGIDHILVDEAQDTSPVQWDVVEKLAQEFTAGEGARADVERTIFVVGDKKQSIYSFQGADPDAFDRMQAEFGRRLEETGEGLQNASLAFSFRSSAAILGLVDVVFDGQDRAGFARDAKHQAFKSDLPGRVDLWPLVEKTEDEEDRDWTDPVDRPSPRHHSVILAERIAGQIKEMIDSGVTIPEDGPERGTFQRRPVHAGDFLILVQRRSDLFSEIIRACKAAGLPIAGADRLKVGAELAVKDIAALLRFLALPEDSLSLAEALKSPIFGWSEQQLFDLAHRRTEMHLWPALRARSEEFPESMAILDDLRGQADFLRPYDLIERILTRHLGRAKLLGRLGTEAEDGINALLSQALAYERTEVPSLTGFLVWMQTDDLEIKRQMGAASSMIRVMSVHGSKGLEAPIVILPDTTKRRPSPAPEVMEVEGTPLWRMSSDQMPPAMDAARAFAQEKQANERLRLLYVALTRAEKWLIVAGAGDLDKGGDSWYQRVEAALKTMGALPFDARGGDGLRWAHGDWNAPPFVPSDLTEEEEIKLPDVFRRAAPAYVAPTATLRPSEDLGGAKALPGDSGLSEEEAKTRGTALHLLLEHLPTVPQPEWDSRAEHIAQHDDWQALLTEARRVLNAPECKEVFAPNTLAEVPITADLGETRMHGIIDRLVVTPDRVLAVDFKSNAVVPQSPETCPEGLLRQMGAYDAALRQIYPDRQIETAILWTRTATLMPLPVTLITQARERAAFQRLEP